MPVDPFDDQETISAYFQAEFAQPFFDDGVPDPYSMTWQNGFLAPYIVAEYAMPISAGGGRSIAGEEKQPTIQRVGFSVVSSDGKLARQVAGRIAQYGVGYIPSPNCGPLRLMGNMMFTIESVDKPRVYVSQVHFNYGSNMAA